MHTAIGQIVAKLVYATDWVLEQMFTVTGSANNICNNECLNQVTVTPTICGSFFLGSVTNLIWALGNLGGEIFTALGVAPAVP